MRRLEPLVSTRPLFAADGTCFRACGPRAPRHRQRAVERQKRCRDAWLKITLYQCVWSAAAGKVVLNICCFLVLKRICLVIVKVKKKKKEVCVWLCEIG